MFGNKSDQEYCAIPKQYFKDKKPYYVKWLTHKGTYKCSAFMWSAACFNMSGVCGYIYVDFGKKRKDDQIWLPAV